MSSAGADFTAGGRACAERRSDLGIANAAQLAPGIYRGAQPTAEGFQALKRLGVRTIVNLREEHSEKREVEAHGFRSVEIPLRADVLGSRAPTREEIKVFLDVVRDPENQPVFFHCRRGCDRAGVMAAIYRMEVEGWSKQDALEEMRRFDFAEFYVSLRRCVEEYQAGGE